jgi:hypothetical protein
MKKLLYSFFNKEESKPNLPSDIERLMTHEEITQKYSGVTCKITLINTPSVIYNIDEKRVVTYPDTYEVIPASEETNGKIRIKPGNRIANVRTYDKLDLIDINNSEEILVYIQKTPVNRWRYIKVEDIVEISTNDWIEGEMYLCYDILIEDWVVGYSKETPGEFRRAGYNPKETHIYEKYKKVKD